MDARNLTLPVPGHEPAKLILPESLTLDALGCLEDALAASLRDLRGEFEHARSEAGAIEYASWLPAAR